MAPTKLVRRPAWPSLAGFTFPDTPLFRNRLRGLFDDSMFRLLEEPITDEFLPEPIGWAPVVDVTETPEEYRFVAELPGLKKEEVKLSWENDVLTLRGEKLREVKKDDEERKYHLFERTYGTFARSFTLPEKIVPEKIAAEMVDGVLTVKVPKAPDNT